MNLDRLVVAAWDSLMEDAALYRYETPIIRRGYKAVKQAFRVMQCGAYHEFLKTVVVPPDIEESLVRAVWRACAVVYWRNFGYYSFESGVGRKPPMRRIQGVNAGFGEGVDDLNYELGIVYVEGWDKALADRQS
jgi:hypothetical protein